MVTDQTRTPGGPDTLEQDIREKFRRSGYTLTSQRRAVFEALKEAKDHPSAEDIYLIVKQKNPRVALGTVYQALSVLEFLIARAGPEILPRLAVGLASGKTVGQVLAEAKAPLPTDPASLDREWAAWVAAPSPAAQ